MTGSSFDQFDIGREILCYRNADDLAELLYYYQARPDECAKIAKAGFERARDYTWEKRFRKVMARWF
ncbi:MAG: glycosyltransferase [Verrucomicrobiota bacterium]